MELFYLVLYVLSTCVFSAVTTSYEQLQQGGNFCRPQTLLKFWNSLPSLPYFLSRRCLSSLVITDVCTPGPLNPILGKETVSYRKKEVSFGSRQLSLTCPWTLAPGLSIPLAPPPPPHTLSHLPVQLVIPKPPGLPLIS